MLLVFCYGCFVLQVMMVLVVNVLMMVLFVFIGFMLFVVFDIVILLLMVLCCLFDLGVLVKVLLNFIGICDCSIQLNIDVVFNGIKNINDVIIVVEL